MTNVAVNTYTHSVTYVADNVDFGVKADADDNTDYRVISVDVVPAFDKDDDFEIPDNKLGKWIKTNPKTHAAKATAAHQAFSNEWKGLVRMVKYWNNNPKHCEKPIKPYFLIEVMALQCLYGGWGGIFERVYKAFSPLLQIAFSMNGPILPALAPQSATGWTPRERLGRETCCGSLNAKPY